MSTILSTLEHYCLEEATCNVHQKPDLYRCPKCNFTATPETVLTVAPGATCPNDGTTLEFTKGAKAGQFHARLCTDKYRHYPEWHADGKISDDEYVAWLQTLTDREKLGFYDRVSLHPVPVELTEAEITMLDRNPTAFQTMLQTKIAARIELALQHEIPHKTKPQQLDMTAHVRGLKKDK